MGLMVKESGGTFTPCPAGTHLGVCISILDLGTQLTPFVDKNTGEPKTAKQVFISWELPNEPMDDGRPFVIGRFYTASLSEKANLRHDLEAWRGRVFTAEELDGFSLKNVLGKACMLSVVHYTKADGSASAKVGSVMALPKGTQAPETTANQKVVFDIDEWDQVVYAGLEEYWRKTIANSVEGKARLSGNAPAAAATNDPGDDLPF
jgi:hypothetical protein